MDKMKNYRQLLKELPTKTIVFTFGRFQPGTLGHELLVKVVKKVASTQKADYAIFVSRTQDKKKNPLTVDRKIHYLNLMFKDTRFVAASDNTNTPIEVVKSLNKKYKNLIMIVGSDRVDSFTKVLNTYNGKEYHYDSIQIISAGERDPDADDAAGMSGSKMRAAAVKGDYFTFKKGLPNSIRDIDGKLLMNEIRIGMGLESIKEQINLVKDTIREQYFKGEIFNIGDMVESNDIQYEIVKRGSNHLLLKEESGTLVSKWIQDVTTVKLGNQEMNEELTTKTIKPNDKLKVARIIASFLSVDNPESLSNPEQIVNMGLRKVRTKALNSESIAMLHKMLSLADEVGIQYDVKLIPQKLKESIDSRVTIDPKSNYNAAKDVMRYSDFKKLMKMNKGEVSEQVDTGVATPAKTMAIRELENQGPSHSEVGSSYGHGDNSHLRRRKVHYQREEVEMDEDVMSADFKIDPFTGHKSRAHRIEFKNSGAKGKLDHKDEVEEAAKVGPKGPIKVGKRYVPVDDSDEISARRGRGYDAFFEETEEELDKITDAELDKMADSIKSLDDIAEAYEDDEFEIIDEDGNVIESDLNEDALMEVLSRVERLRAKSRFAKTKSKRERSTKIALKRHSSTAVINHRARKLAVNLIKQRIAKKPLNKLSIGEKERIERIIQKKKTLIDRLAMKLTSRVRKVETDRLAHHKFTKK